MMVGDVMLKERRQDGRIFFDMPAELTIANTSYPVEQIANLSLGGCLLGIKDNLRIGAECNLTIKIDNTPPGLKIDVNGVIVRNNSSTTAIKFTKIEPDNLYHLRNIIKYTLPFLKYHPVGRDGSSKR